MSLALVGDNVRTGKQIRFVETFARRLMNEHHVLNIELSTMLHRQFHDARADHAEGRNVSGLPEFYARKFVELNIPPHILVI